MEIWMIIVLTLWTIGMMSEQMDAIILFVMPPLLGYGIYLLMKNNGKLEDFVQSMIGYMKRIGKKKDE